MWSDKLLEAMALTAAEAKSLQEAFEAMDAELEREMRKEARCPLRPDYRQRPSLTTPSLRRCRPVARAHIKNHRNRRRE